MRVGGRRNIIVPADVGYEVGWCMLTRGLHSRVSARMTTE